MKELSLLMLLMMVFSQALIQGMGDAERLAFDCAMQAIRNDDIQELQKLVQGGVDPDTFLVSDNVSDNSGRVHTLLGQAISCGNLKAAQVIVEDGVTTYGQNKYHGQSLFKLALRLTPDKRYQFIGLLLSAEDFYKRAVEERRQPKPWRGPKRFSNGRQKKIIRNEEAQDAKYTHWLLDAIEADDAKAVGILMACYPYDVTTLQTTLAYVLKAEFSAQEKEVLKKSLIVQSSDKAIIALIKNTLKEYIPFEDRVYAMRNDIKKFQELINQGLNIEEEGPLGTHLITIATREGNIEAVRVLMAARAKTHYHDECTGESLFRIALKLPGDVQYSMMRLLLDAESKDFKAMEQGVEIYVTPKDEYSRWLIDAVQENNVVAVQLLMTACTNADVYDTYLKKSALHIAQARGNIQIVDLLKRNMSRSDAFHSKPCILSR